jgi:hypothetical protein
MQAMISRLRCTVYCLNFLTTTQRRRSGKRDTDDVSIRRLLVRLFSTSMNMVGSEPPMPPSASTPQEQQGTRPWALGPPIRVGDVGFVCDGVFCRLFSAALPADDPAQRDLGVPHNFAPLPIPEQLLDFHANPPPSAVRSQEWCALRVHIQCLRPSR